MGEPPEPPGRGPGQPALGVPAGAGAGGSWGPASLSRSGLALSVTLRRFGAPANGRV